MVSSEKGGSALGSHSDGRSLYDLSSRTKLFVEQWEAALFSRVVVLGDTIHFKLIQYLLILILNDTILDTTPPLK